MTEEYSLYRYPSFKDDQPYRYYVQYENPKDTGQHKHPDEPAPSPLTHESYGALLFHPNWKSKRKEILSKNMHRPEN